MKALVMGGTGFIGRRLVDHLLRENWDITVASSGKSGNPFGDAVSTVTFDRFDISSMEEKLSSPPYFDAVFDQIGFGTDDVKRTIELFRNRAGRYVFTSSAAVYAGKSGTLSEEQFDSHHYSAKDGGIGELGYAEGKKSAEAYLLQNAPFPVAAARFPIVMGHDDSTQRFQNHVSRVNTGGSFIIPENCQKRNYVWVSDAGRFLAWLGSNGKEGPYNAATAYGLTAIELVERMGKVLGKKPSIDTGAEGRGDSSYYGDTEMILSVRKAENEGFKFTPIDEWLPHETMETLEKGGISPNSSDYIRELLSRKK